MAEQGSGMPIGKVYFYNQAGGFGVIVPEMGGNDAFVHASALGDSGMTDLRQGQRVSYVLRTDARGQSCACKLSLAEPVPLAQAMPLVE